MYRRRLLLSAMLVLTIVKPASPTDNVTIIAEANVTIGAGFGELTPGPHDLSIMFQVNGFSGYCLGNATDSGSTIWNYDSMSAPTSPKVVCYGATEDQMGWIYANGYCMDPGNFIAFGAAFANITFPCFTSCDPMDPMGGMMCDTTREGEVKVTPGSTAHVTVAVQHGVGGTLTVVGADGDLEIFDQNDDPFTSVHLDGSGVDGVTLTLHASIMFGGPVTLRAVFENDNGPLDSQDIVIVKKLIKLDKIVVDASDPPDEGPTGVEISDTIVLRALSDPASQSFDDGEPIWTIVSQPYGSQTSISSGSDTVSLTPDLPGAYTIRAIAGEVSDDFEVWAVKLIKQNLGPTGPASADY